MKLETNHMMKSLLLLGVLGIAPLVHAYEDELAQRQSAAFTKPKTSPNAALIYWQAFAALPPKPEGDDKAKFEEWLGKSESAIKLLQRASAIQACDWQLDYDQGFEMEIPHLSKMRALTKAAIAHAKHVSKSDNTQSHADLQAVMRAARHLGCDNPLIVQLTRASIELETLEALKSELPNMTDETRQSWVALLDALPKPPTLAQMIQVEHQGAMTTLKKMLTVDGYKNLDKETKKALEAADPSLKPDAASATGNAEAISSAKLQTVLDQVDADYRALEGIAEGPTEKLDQTVHGFIAKIDKNKGLSQLLISDITSSAKKMQQCEEKAAEIRKLMAAK